MQPEHVYNLQTMHISAPFLAAVSPVGWSDIVAILPALVLFLTGGIVLVMDLFLRGWTDSPRKGEKWLLHYFSLLGTVVAAALDCASLARGETAAGDYFRQAIVVDSFSLAMSLLILLGTLLSLLGAMDALRRRDLEHGEFHALVLFAAGAMILFTQSASLVMLFLSLETLSMSVFVLTAYTREEKRSVEGALKYFVLGGLSSAFLLFGLVLIYGATGATTLVEIARTVKSPGGAVDVPLLVTGLGLALVGLCFKVGAFPFHSWVPDAYEGALTVVSGFMAVTVKAASFAVLLRLTLLFLPASSPDLKKVQDLAVAALSSIAVLTMIFGNVVAVVQSSVKRMLAYSAIAHTGYLLVGVVAALGDGGGGLAPRAAASAAVMFYLLPYSLMTAGAFTLLSYLGSKDQDRETFAEYRGLAQERPLCAIALLVLMVSFAGIPPTAGFWGKLFVFREALETGHWILALVGIVTSVISVYYYLRLAVNMYMRAGEPRAAAPEENQTASGLVIAFTAAAVALLGLFPDQFFRLSIAFALP